MATVIFPGTSQTEPENGSPDDLEPELGATRCQMNLDGTGTGWNQSWMELEPAAADLTLTLGPENSIFARFGPFGTRIRL